MDDEIDGLQPARVFFMDTNLSSPILTTEIEATRQMLLRTALYAEDHSKMWKGTVFERSEYFFMKKLCNHNQWSRAMLRSSSPLMPESYPDMEASFLVTPPGFVSLYSEARMIAKEIEVATEMGLEARGLPREGISGTVDALESEDAAPYRYAYEQFSDFFSRAESRVKTNEHAWTHGRVGEVLLWIHPRYSLILHNGTFIHSSLNQVLMLKDKLATRFMLLEHVSPLRLSIDLSSHLLSLFRWQDRTLQEYGNRAYGILKAVEPMFKTRLSHVTDNVFGNDTAYTRMISKIREKEDKLKREIGSQYSSLNDLIVLVEGVKKTEELVEMFGCMKSCGHPLIDAEKGGLSAAQEARSPDQTSLVSSQNLRNTFCHIILVSYIDQHGQWPALQYKVPGTTLEILNTRQERAINHSSYPLDDWTGVEWQKMFDMDYYPNFLELMDDKSISYYRSEKHLSWDKGKRPGSERRLLLEVLSRKDINIEQLVKRVSKRDIPDDWFIVSLYPKEREFKEDPRMFSMLVLEMRCFFTCIEANIADHVFKYMPQQTMTKTKTQIQERFLSFTDPYRDPTSLTLFLEIDLSRWNLRWREMTVHQIGHDINRMFGVKGTFTITHWFFSLCQILVRVGGLRPEGIDQDLPPETGLAWRDHLGGFEGLNQKLWTAATYAMVEMALAPLLKAGIITSYELIGQGDNQVIRVTIPHTGETREVILSRTRDDINDRLEKTCADVNQVVKPDENIESTTVLTYSKDVYVKGVEYPTSLKKHSRLFPVTAMDFPSISMKASAIMAGAVSGGENSKHSLCSASIGWYHTARFLLAAGRGRSIHGSSLPRLTTSDIISALILPPSIGGMIGTPIASFLYKGGSDPLGKEVSSLRLLADGEGLAAEIASRALRGLEERYYINPEPNLETLIDNPYSLPIEKHTSPLSKVSHLTLHAFRNKVRNQDIKPLLEERISQAESVLKQDILSIRPLNPLLAHDLFDASGYGTIKLMRKMFLATRTVQTVAQIVNPNITHQFLNADINDIKWFKTWALGLPKRGYSGSSSFDLVTKFRKYWGVDLHGVTNYQPLDYYHKSGTTRDPSSIKWSSHSSENLLTTRGPLSGYLGSATREKRSEHGYKIVDAGAPSRSMMKLQLIRSQAYGDIYFNLLIDRIGLTRTNVPLSEITDLLQKVLGGSIAHRYATAIRNMAASYVGPLNFVTHIRIDTDSLGKISGSALNYPIMTQEFMVFTQSGAKLLNIHKGVKMGELIIDSSKMESLPDDALVAKNPKFTDASLPKSNLLYTDSLLIARTYDSVVQQVPRGAVAHVNVYSEKETVEHGATGFFIELLRDNYKARTLTDTRGISAIPARLQMDIAEAHALGPFTLTKCMAYALITSLLRDTFRTLHLHPERWDESLFLTHNIHTCVRACAQYWKHPLFFSHPDSDKFRSSPMKYAGWMTSDKVIASEVRRQLMTIMSKPEHPYWKSPIPVFSGSKSMALSEALSTAGAKILYPLYITGTSYAREFGNLFSSFARLPTRKPLTPDQQLSLLRARMTKLSKIYWKQGDIQLSERIADLGHMKGTLVFNDDFRTVLRYARTLAAGEGSHRPKTLRVTDPPPALNWDHCSECCPPPRSKHENMWTRYSARPNGGVTTAGYTWIPILRDIRVMRQVMIVGAGNGGLADLLIRAYGCDVIGTDLESDLPTESATLLNYVPIGVSRECAGKFTESDLCLTTDGDWFNPLTRTEFLSQVSTMTSLFFDATVSFDLPKHDEMVNDVMNSMLIDRLYIRVIGEQKEIQKWIQILRKKGRHIRSWYVSVGYHEVEEILEITRSSDYLHECRCSLPLIQMVPKQHDVLIPSRKAETLRAAACSVIPWSGETLDQMYIEIGRLCQSLLNKPRQRQLLYRDRMALIYAYSTYYAACSPDPSTLIQEWISEESVRTDLFVIDVRDSLITHLLRYVPRVRALLRP